MASSATSATKSALHHTLEHSSRTISAEGCLKPSQDSHFTARLSTRQARSPQRVHPAQPEFAQSPQRVHPAQPEFAFHHTLVEYSTHTISAEGRVSQALSGQAPTKEEEINSRDISYVLHCFTRCYIICLLVHMCLLQHGSSESNTCFAYGFTYISKTPAKVILDFSLDFAY